MLEPLRQMHAANVRVVEREQATHRPSASPSLEDVPVIEPQAAELLVHYDSRAVHDETLRFEV
jgi:hypothetical protein